MAKAKGVSCGFDHTLAIDESGRLYSSGENKYGQLGVSKEQAERKSQDKAYHIVADFGKDVRAVKVSAGKEFSVILCDKGQVYTCGLNSHSRLGLGKDMADTLHIDKFTQVPHFRDNNIKVKDIAAGGRHCLALCVVDENAPEYSHDRHGSLFVWGCNKAHQLGQGEHGEDVIHSP